MPGVYRGVLVVSLVVVLGAVGPLVAATITIINNDDPGEGFSDTTPTAQVGGNPGTTLGAQRLIVVQAAAKVWADRLVSDVEIRVGATFDPMLCNASSAVLGAAGAAGLFFDFPSAPLANTWYHGALADSLAGADQYPGVVDINAIFNTSLDDDPACLGGVGWYYGLDGVPGEAEDLFPTVVHELGHGLGFQSFINVSTGAWLNQRLDAFGLHAFDISEGRAFPDMVDDAARQVAITDTLDVVWNGPLTQAASAEQLDRTSAALRINSPASIAGDFDALYGRTQLLDEILAMKWGGVLDPAGITAYIELADPADGCDVLTGFTPGRIALIDRGTCEFGFKANMAEDAGAVAALIVDDRPEGLVLMAGGATSPTVSTVVPVIVRQVVGEEIKAELVGGGSVNVTLGLFRLSQATTDGRPYLFTPDPVQVGSSLSHFDWSFSPHQLMQPVSFQGDDGSPGLAWTVFEDIGWEVVVPIFSDGFETGDTTGWSEQQG